MNCWNRFDSIVCLHAPTDKSRMAGLMVELERIGILSSGRFRIHYSPVTFTDKVVFESLRMNGYKTPETVGQFSCLTGHRHIIETELARGSNSVLIIEDDVRFLKDVAKTERIVSEWNPSRCGHICIFDRFVWDRRLVEQIQRETTTYIPFDKNVRGGSCYALSRAGMEAMKAASDNLARNRKQIVMNDLLYDYATTTKCLSRECVCVQKQFYTANNLRVYHCNNYDVYNQNGVDLENYNIE